MIEVSGNSGELPAEAASGLNDGLGRCQWWSDEDGIWWSCPDPKGGEHAFGFECDGPDENGFKFCPFCGKPLEVRRIPAEPTVGCEVV